MKRNRILAIVGPTATGKSELALEVAKYIPSEIVSADSMQVYKSMDIGTAKVKPIVRKKIKHHLIDVVSIQEPFNVYKYQQLARQAIETILQSGKTPIVAGGSGLYIRAALYKLNFCDNAQDAQIHQELEKQLNERGLHYLQKKLKEKDLKAFESIDLNNSRRLIRALEIIEKTGKPYSSLREDWHNWRPLYDATFIGLTMERDELYERINQRVDKMMESGLIEETKKLMELGLREAIIAKQALGYKEFIDYLDGKESRQKVIETLKKRTRQYAKRQYTWLRRDPNITWYDISQTPVQALAQDIVQKYKESQL